MEEQVGRFGLVTSVKSGNEAISIGRTLLPSGTRGIEQHFTTASRENLRHDSQSAITQLAGGGGYYFLHLRNSVVPGKKSTAGRLVVVDFFFFFKPVNQVIEADLISIGETSERAREIDR